MHMHHIAQIAAADIHEAVRIVVGQIVVYYIGEMGNAHLML